jgi:hypothetical protein
VRPYYEQDGITIYLGDCRDVDAWAGASALVTDPPYGIGWSRGVNAARGSKPSKGIVGDESTEARDVVLHMWGEPKWRAFGARPAAVFGSLYVAPPQGVRHVCVWEKPPDSGVVGSTTGFRRDVEAIYLIGDWPRRPPAWGSVLRSLAPSAGNPSSPAGRTGHPHAKPVDLMGRLIGLLPPGVIADPFAGSGSTLVAAKLAGRHAIGIEIDERHCEVAARRLDQGVLGLGVA